VAARIQFGCHWPPTPSTASGYGHRFGGSAWAHRRARELVGKIRAGGVELIGRAGCSPSPASSAALGR
jgi:hypothetical protein